MRILYLAGETAKLHGISKQTLLYYDRIGLFCPEHCDENSGYRYYSVAQFVDLDVILCLKNFGMPLEEIKSYLQQTKVEQRIGMLEEHRAVVDQKIAELNTSKKRLNKTIGNLKDRTTIVPFATGIEKEEARRFVRQEVASPYDEECFEIAIKTLLEQHKNRSDTGIDELLVFTTRAADTNSPLFHRVGLEVQEKPYELLPAAQRAYIYHQGVFETMGNSYKTLLEYIAAQGYCPSGNYVMEKILLDALAVSSQEEYLIKIQIPVVKKERAR